MPHNRKGSIMALQVKRTGKSGGDITSLCGDGFNHSKATAVANIGSGTENYFVREVAPSVDVHVTAQGHLRTNADASSANNLDNLPDC